ncbi:alpha/beta fold hydrolase [Gordonia pseudamarae]|mgnify:CR=1 FL=1|uniref:Alpha/beta fold hydrolase n=1 Tax=Gordonia pseudamarae TaxID=2831662 RepID=A0ABX6IK31_9ACTN|nr:MULTISPECIES: alpha/beta hydrolase [Gordonia]MBD0022786.1 alpha/beta hydrolase [Gordonia sp. (in: high G+C Gram-positive bacteria)]QHN27383.1 alpha/beta fold hydrolase [Gordonia pseudamarae]QHN36267.1 alpha/beta fold hydrolase [Gordonia pseudamarae]
MPGPDKPHTPPPGTRPGAPNLRPVSDTRIRIEYRTVHGYRRAFRIAGGGPALLLIHGIGDNSSTWDEIIPTLAQHYTVIAPDLLGHGQSDKPRADYSVAAFANGMRDLLVVLGIPKVTVIGHSLGGGVAMQFCYQFPRFVERLVLVAAGGVMREVNPVLRMVTLPGAGELLAMLRIPGVLPAVRWGVDKLADAPRLPGVPAGWSPSGALKDHDDLLRVVSGLADPGASKAFLRTLHAVVDWRGQSVTMLDRCYLTERLPMLVLWGDEDTVIPYHHAIITNTVIPHSELVTFEGSGHFPFHDDPERFTRTLIDFIERTTPLDFDPLMWRELMSSGGAQTADFEGDEETIDEVLEAFEDERSAT